MRINLNKKIPLYLKIDWNGFCWLIFRSKRKNRCKCSKYVYAEQYRLAASESHLRGLGTGLCSCGQGNLYPLLLILWFQISTSGYRILGSVAVDIERCIPHNLNVLHHCQCVLALDPRSFYLASSVTSFVHSVPRQVCTSAIIVAQFEGS